MLAVAGGKGGVGKTTTTLGLARALASDGTGVVAVDADWDLPDLGALAGGPRRTDLSATAEAVPAPAPEADGDPDATPDVGPAGIVDAAFGLPSAPAVRVLPAPSAPADRDAGRVLRRVAAASASGAEVLVDCPAGAGPDAAAPLRAAAAALLVSEPCAPALRDAAKAAAMARALDTPVVGAVLTRARFAPPAVSSLLGCPVLACVPRTTGPPLDDPDVRASYRTAAADLADRPDSRRRVARDKR